jgi:hypothetical protein
MKKTFAALILIPTVLLASLTSEAARRLQTSSVAQVAHHVITSREVRMNALVDQALFGAPSTAPDGATQIQSVITEWCVYLEAESFSYSTVQPSEVNERVSQVNKTLANHKEWNALGATDVEITEMVRRKLIAKGFMDFKADSSRVPVSEEEALAYYQKNQSKFGTLPFSNFKDSITKYLVQSHLESRLRNWLELLHSKYNVRLITPPGAKS